jgi:hypothetical protein
LRTFLLPISIFILLTLFLPTGCTQQKETPTSTAEQHLAPESSPSHTASPTQPPPSTTPTYIPTLEPFAAQGITAVCLLAEETYEDSSHHSHQVTPTTELISEHRAMLTKWLEQAGIEVVSNGQDCHATLRIQLAYFALGQSYIGAPREACYTGALVEGRILLEKPQQDLGTSYVQAELPTLEGTITSCPLEQQAPFEYVWAEAVLEGLASLWSSEIPRQALLEDGAYQLQAGAALALGNIGSDAWTAVPTLYAMTIDRIAGPEKGATHGDMAPEGFFINRSERAAARYALEQIIGSDDETSPTLLSNLQSESVEERIYAVIGLAWLMPQDMQVVQRLIETLHNESEDPVIYSLLMTIGKYGSQADEAVPILVEMSQDAEPPLIYVLLETLGDIGPKAMEAVPILTANLESDDWQVVSSARVALEQITGQDLGTDPNLWRQWWQDR